MNRSAIDPATDPATETPGERWRREHPDWPDQCCAGSRCGYRTFRTGTAVCASPAACEFRVPDAKKGEHE